MLLLPLSAKAQNRTADKAWWLVTAASVGATVADIENTQFCMKDFHCQEGNPIYFSRRPSRLRMYSINAGIMAPMLYYSYKWKREDDADRAAGRQLAKYRWYAIPVINIAAHGFGLTITLSSTGR
jgi:hypothetical protein